MNSRERVKAIIAGETPDRCAFWLGNPDPESWPLYYDYFNCNSQEQIRRMLGDDFRWTCPQFYEDSYRHPQGREIFPIPGKKAHGDAGPFAGCEDAGDVDAYEWPNADYLDFTSVLQELENVGDCYRASGMFTPFYHNVMDLFSMESYLVKMYTHPEVVHAVTDRVCQFYHEANERFFEEAGDLIDGYLFGNDFGTQLDLICGPAQFDEFILPWFGHFTDLGHRYGHQVILHSCGAIHKVIDRLIDLGVDALHPLQAKAADMDAETLARDFKGRVAFIGGIDTQELLVNGTPEEVAADVRRVKSLLGPSLLVSPSHEAILPNVPPENVEAMARAVLDE